MPERAHLSIGEVLALLQEEFPDVTISKIRFLESQGLLDPERTPSGYRKFYESDIERLRWILQQQRENFLPLRVIKDRLEGKVSDGAEVTGEPADEHAAVPEPELAAVSSAPAPASAEPAPAPVPAPPVSPTRTAAPPAATATPSPAARPSSRRSSALDSGPSAVSLTRDELASATGLPDKLITELERYSLVEGRPMGRDTLYDEEALVVARLAAGFLRFGVEARHLRMYKVSAEREASFFEQVVLPLVKQRNPAARRQAVENLSELASLGESLRGAMLRHALKGYNL
jgi:DNA-binding transcriptional MerR regulator